MRDWHKEDHCRKGTDVDMKRILAVEVRWRAPHPMTRPYGVNIKAFWTKRETEGKQKTAGKKLYRAEKQTFARILVRSVLAKRSF